MTMPPPVTPPVDGGDLRRGCRSMWWLKATDAEREAAMAIKREIGGGIGLASALVVARWHLSALSSSAARVREEAAGYVAGLPLCDDCASMDIPHGIRQGGA